MNKLRDNPQSENLFRRLIKSCSAGAISFSGSLFLLTLLLILFGVLIQHFEAQEEIRLNEEINSLIRSIEIDLNESSAEKLFTLIELIGFNSIEGIQGFSSFNKETLGWRGNTIDSITSSVAYAFDITSTVGYGSVEAKTRGGRVISIIAIFVLFPLTVVCYTRLAEYVNNFIGNSLILRSRQYRDVIERYDEHSLNEIDVKELYLIFQDLGLHVTDKECKQILTQYDISHTQHLNEAELRQLCVDLHIGVGLLARPHLQLETSLVLFLAYLLLYTVISHLAFIDNMFDSFYFVIITLTTVGLGDIVPPQNLRAIFSVLSFIGIGFLALVFRAVIDKIFDKTDLKKRYFHRALEPVFKEGRIVSIRLKDKLVPEENDFNSSVDGST